MKPIETYRILRPCVLSMCLPLIVCACSKPAPSLAENEEAVKAVQQGLPPSLTAKPAPGTMISFPPVPVLPADKRCVGDSRMENGGFESAPEGKLASWTLEAKEPAKLEQVQDCAAEGQSSLRATAPANVSFEATQQVKNLGHREYLLRCLVLPRDMSGQVRLAVRDTAQSGKVVSAQSEAIAGTQKTWTPLQVEFEVQATVPEVTVALQHEAAGEGSDAMGTVWFDQCELYMIGAPSRQNLLKNGDFSEGPEKELAQWQWWQKHKISRDFGLGTAHSLKVDCQPGQSVTFMQLIEDAVKPGQRYVFRGYMKTENATGKATLEIGKQGGWTLTATEAVSSQDWTWVKTSFTAPDDCKGLLALLFCRRDKEQPTSPCTVWFADVELLAAVDKE